MEKVSIIVPIYMIEAYLPQCIESILAQTYDDIEIILVDDGSEDQCGKIIDEYASRDSRIRAIHKQNGGLVSARKTGMRCATGKYVVYIDGDDWVEDDFVSSLVEVVEQEKADVVTSGYINETGTNYDAIPTGVYQSEDERNLIYKNMLSMGRFYTFGIQPFLWNKIYRRELLMNFQLKVDEQICVGEDVACLYPMLLAAKKIVISGICGYHYRSRENSLTSSQRGRVDETEKHLINRYHFLKKVL